MIEYLFKSAPVVLALIFYFVRLESRLSQMSTDILWIKKNCNRCQPILEKPLK